MQREFKNFKNCYKKECPNCHKMFETGRGNQHYCSAECKKEWSRVQNRINNKNRRQQCKLEDEMPSERVKKSKEDLAKADRVARAAGMSYGKYYEKQYIEKMRVKK